jgi:hypothetical protein
MKSEQLASEERIGEYVVTKDGAMYWVRRKDGTNYWPSVGLYFFKFFAIRRARQLAGARRLHRNEIIVWSSHD